MATPAQRRMASQIGNAHRWAYEPDRPAATQAARNKRMENLAKKVDPAGVLPPEELAKRVRTALKEQMTRAALASSKARRKSA